MRRFWWQPIRQSDAVTALLARTDRSKGSSAAHFPQVRWHFAKFSLPWGAGVRPAIRARVCT